MLAKSMLMVNTLGLKSFAPKYGKYLVRLGSTSKQRYASTASTNENSTFNEKNGQDSKKVKNGVNYSIAISLGTTIGLVAGYVLLTESSDNFNEASRSLVSTKFEPTKQIERRESKYYDFPLKIHLYQYESCPYCSQIRAYLDYFGFSYTLTEVDSYSKEEITKFTKARILPIMVIEDRLVKKRWHLANATSILSALESARNDKPINFPRIFDQHLPVLKGNVVYNTSNPFKYHIGNNVLNSIEWRKWINNVAIPAFKLNSLSTLKDLFETFDYIAETSHWKQRYGPFKYSYVYYTHAFKAYASRLDHKNNLSSAWKDKNPREILHQVVDKWEKGLGDKQFIDSNDYPNIADISMYGNVSAYEGCSLYREIIAKHPKFRVWYERMKLVVLKGYQESIVKKKHEFLAEPVSTLDSDNDFEIIDDNYEINKNLESYYSYANDNEKIFKKSEKEEKEYIEKKNDSKNLDREFEIALRRLCADINASTLPQRSLNTSSNGLPNQSPTFTTTTTTITNNNNNNTNTNNTNSNNNLSEFLIFRILTINYLAHVVAFTYAAWMK